MAGYRLERIVMGCAEPPSSRGSVHPISVLELTKKTKWMGGVCHVQSIVEYYNVKET